MVWYNSGTKDALDAFYNSASVEIELYPGVVYGYNNIAHCYIELGQRAKATEYFEKLLQYPEKVDPEYVRKKIESL